MYHLSAAAAARWLVGGGARARNSGLSRRARSCDAAPLTTARLSKHYNYFFALIFHLLSELLTDFFAIRLSCSHSFVE